MIKNRIKKLTDLGVSNNAINCLTKEVDNSKLINSDLIKLEKALIHYDSIDFEKEYHSYIWTLLGELTISARLEPYINIEWPILLFPFENNNKSIELITEFLEVYECRITSTSDIYFTELLQSCLYGGQTWYDSLKELYDNIFTDKDKKSKLIWFIKKEHGKWDTASVAKKLQTQLRPQMKSIEMNFKNQIYPGVIKAFHTPKIENIPIHRYILKLKRWEKSEL